MLRAAPGLILCLFACAAFAQADVQPGQWELSIEASVPGGMKNQQSMMQCLSETDARDPSRVLMGKGGMGSTCSLDDKRDSGGHIDFGVTCAGPLPLSGRGSVDYTATTMSGTLDLQFKGEGAAALPGGISSRISGRRLGAC
jgi:hypothetical protein